jgi:hypothetical protein
MSSGNFVHRNVFVVEAVGQLNWAFVFLRFRWHVLRPARNQGPNINDINIKEFVPETAFDMLLAIPGRRTVVHDRCLMGVGRFVRPTGIRDNILYVPFLVIPFWSRRVLSADRTQF